MSASSSFALFFLFHRLIIVSFIVVCYSASQVMLEVTYKLQLLSLITANLKFVQLNCHFCQVGLRIFECSDLRLNSEDFHFNALFLTSNVSLKLVHSCPRTERTRISKVRHAELSSFLACFILSTVFLIIFFVQAFEKCLCDVSLALL